MSNAEDLLSTTDEPASALVALIRGHIDFTMTERALCEVYLQELKNLPASDRRRFAGEAASLRRPVDLLEALHPELSQAQAQVRVHAAISAIHSVLLYHSQLDEAGLADELFAVISSTLHARAPHAIIE